MLAKLTDGKAQCLDIYTDDDWVKLSLVTLSQHTECFSANLTVLLPFAQWASCPYK